MLTTFKDSNRKGIFKKIITLTCFTVFCSTLTHGSEKGNLDHRVLLNMQRTAIVSDVGQIYAYGCNRFWGLGRGNSSKLPLMVEGINAKVLEIYRGASHQMVRTTEGLYAWGLNDAGQLGTGNYESTYTPVLVTGINCKEIEKIFTNQNGTFVIKKDGTLHVWGSNDNGQLGLGHKNDVNTPTQVTSLGNGKVVFLYSGITSRTDRSTHTIISLRDGRNFATGLSENEHNHLGTPNKSLTQFTLIPEISGVIKKVDKIFNKFSYLYYAIMESGDVYTWGNFNKKIVPINLLKISNQIGKIKEIYKKYDNDKEIILLTEDGDAYIHKIDQNFHLIEPDKTIKLTFSSEIDEKIVTHADQYYLTNKGNLYSYSLENHQRILLKGVEGKIVKFISYKGRGTYFVINERGDLYSWGDNWYGQAGVGSTRGDFNLILSAPKDTRVTEVVPEMSSALAFLSNGNIYGWGKNCYGANVTWDTTSERPEKIEGLPTFFSDLKNWQPNKHKLYPPMFKKRVLAFLTALNKNSYTIPSDIRKLFIKYLTKEEF